MTLSDRNGKPVHLDLKLASGGEADIYALRGRGDQVAKIYFRPSVERSEKLAAMISSPPSDPTLSQGHVSICWPNDILLDQFKRNCVGFLMHRADFTTNVPVLELYNPRDRRRVAPGFTWDYLVGTAANIASVVEAVHARGYVVGDINESNFLVSDRALVTLVDCDSMQVPKPGAGFFRCTVGKPDFTPPELQGRDFSQTDRDSTHDNFALGVMVFHLLMEGVHPYAGIWRGAGEPLPQDRIRTGDCPYAGSPLVAPMPGAVPFDILPSPVRALFVRCFGYGHKTPATRPSPREWREALNDLQHNLDTCSANRRHIYPNHLQNCPWCERTVLLRGSDPYPESVQQRPLKTAAFTVHNIMGPPAPATASQTLPAPSGFASGLSGGGTAPAAPKIGVSRAWSIALGWIVFFLILFFGQGLANNAGRSHPQPSGSLAWAVFYSLFGAAVLAGVMVTGFLLNKRKRAIVAAVLSAASTVTFFVLLVIAVRPEHADLRVALPVEDKLVGASIGYPSGVQWQHALGDRGAIFSAANGSRIEYPGLIPSEGTLEFWIKVNSGYGYNNFQLRTNQDDAMIFSSDAQGGDVTWPGTTRFSVSRTGTLSYWMATSKYNKPPASPTEARKTKFRFGEWHAIGLSYGTEGQYIMLDGKLVAASPGLTQTFGRAGNHQDPLDSPTIGETVSHYWPRHRVEGGFEGVVAAFRVSATQTDWKLAQGVKGDITPEAIDTGENRAPDGGPHQWTELKLGDRKGDFALNTDHRLYYRNVVLQGFVIPSESDGAWVSPSSSNGDVLCFSMGNQAQGILIHLPTLTGVVVLDGSKFAFGLSAVQWTSWSPDGGYWLAAHYNEAHVELFVIDARDREARRVPISLANEHEELAFDLDSVTWESTDRFRMRAKINCNPYTSQETCSDAERKKTLRVYDLVVNARSLDVSSTVQPGPPKSADVPGEGSTPSENGSGSLSSRFDPSERLLRRDELDGLTKWDLEILRNLPYARHGYSFRQQELKNYFSEQPWYRATVPAEQFRPSTLTPVERENITLISQFQKERGLGVSAADQVGPPKSADLRGESKVPVTPSFDCSKARTPTERLICREPDLALMEREMVSAYKQAIERASTDQKAVVRREHVQWFNRYARACDAVPAAERRDCITRELRNRTEELRGSGNRTALPDGTLKPYRVGQGVFPPAVLSKVEPLYSDQARNAKLQGNVLVQLVVDEHGLPRQIRVMRSLGMGLDEKAVEAVQRWRFRPGMKDGHAVSVQATIEVNFRLL